MKELQVNTGTNTMHNNLFYSLTKMLHKFTANKMITTGRRVESKLIGESAREWMMNDLKREFTVELFF